VTRAIFLFLSAFLASGVEVIEATTIVLAVGITRGWRSTAFGVVAATVALVALVAALGPAVSSLPIDVLRLVVGGVLLTFGLGWLRKSILRASGYLPLHDEEAIYERQRAAASGGDRRVQGVDWNAFALSFKGVLLEGLEVVFIVISFGAARSHGLAVAAIAAGAALVLVVAFAAIVRGPLTRVPENAIKFGVGLLLTSFGTFWGAEGAGVAWPGSDLALLAILALMLVVSVSAIVLLRRRRELRGGSALAHGASA
jgi:uncharacterized membrane protein